MPLRRWMGQSRDGSRQNVVFFLDIKGKNGATATPLAARRFLLVRRHSKVLRPFGSLVMPLIIVLRALHDRAACLLSIRAAMC